MVNNIFRALYLIVATCLVIVLYGIYRNMEQANRYKVISAGQNSLNIFDTKTRKIYNYAGRDLYDQRYNEIKEIPK